MLRAVEQRKFVHANWKMLGINQLFKLWQYCRHHYRLYRHCYRYCCHVRLSSRRYEDLLSEVISLWMIYGLLAGHVRALLLHNQVRPRQRHLLQQKVGFTLARG